MSIEDDSDETALLEGAERIEAWLRSGEKAPEAFRVGLEHEKLAYRMDSLAALDYADIRQVLLSLQRVGWEPRPSAEEPVALERDGAWVSLEPGGQLELAGPPYRSLHESAVLRHNHGEELLSVCSPLGEVIESDRTRADRLLERFGPGPYGATARRVILGRAGFEPAFG